MTRETIEPGQWWRPKNQPYAPAKEIIAVYPGDGEQPPIVITRVWERKGYQAIDAFCFIERHSEVKEAE